MGASRDTGAGWEQGRAVWPGPVIQLLRVSLSAAKHGGESPQGPVTLTGGFHQTQGSDGGTNLMC